MTYENENNVMQSVLNQFDFTQIDQMDPSLGEGHKIVFDREVPLELRIHEGDSGPQQVGTLEAVQVKVLQLVFIAIFAIKLQSDDSNNQLQNIKIELQSENDLFFHYTAQIDEDYFKQIQENQKLTIDFPDLTQVIIKMLTSCTKEPHSFLAVFAMSKDGQATLDIIQNIEYKFIELLSLDFVASPEDHIRQLITYRYNSVKSKLALMQARLTDVNNMMKTKSPQLLLQMKKTGTKGNTNSNLQSSIMRSRINM